MKVPKVFKVPRVPKVFTHQSRMNYLEAELSRYQNKESC